MSTSEWRTLRAELESRGYSVSVKGRSKKEYIAEKDSHIVDIYRGGVTGTGTMLHLFIYNVAEDNMDFEMQCRNHTQVLKYIDDYAGDWG